MPYPIEYFEERDQSPFLSIPTVSSTESCSRDPSVDDERMDCDDRDQYRYQPRVRFDDVKDDASKSPPPYYAKLTRVICKELWYQSSDIKVFKQIAQKELLSDNDECDIERYNWHRISAKKKAIRVLLGSQKRCRDPHFLRRISKQISSQAVEVALQVGQRSFHQVYYPKYVLPAKFNYTQDPYHHKRKHFLPPVHVVPEDRRVRQRTRRTVFETTSF